jgi:Pretoxin HINT domain/HNH/ENDO VII superfamily nuclease with conserved GHE residues
MRLAWKKVEELFVRFAPIMNLHVGGKIIRTTAEHPFYVYNKGWVACAKLQIGDVLSSHDGQRVTVEGVAFSGECATVYNVSVADWHTYFIGQEQWTFSAWTHNVLSCSVADTSQAKANYRRIFAKEVSLRETYMGRTPGKSSKTDRAVQERMRANGDLRTRNGVAEIRYTDPVDGKVKWQKLDKTVDMAHTQDAVAWWNETGRHYGPKSPEVRAFMLNPDNYTLQPARINRSQGASLGVNYMPPVSGGNSGL